MLENLIVSEEGSNAVMGGGESTVFCAPYFPVYFPVKLGFGRFPGNSSGTNEPRSPVLDTRGLQTSRLLYDG